MFPLEFRGQFLSSICICRGFLMITSEWTLKVAAGNQLFGLNQTAFCQERSNICFVHRCDTQLKVSVTLICHHCGVTTWDVCQAPQPANCDEALCHREAARGLDDPDLQIANPRAAIYIYTRLLQLGHLGDAACFCLLVHPCMTQLCERPRLGRDVAIVSTIPPKKAPLY